MLVGYPFHGTAAAAPTAHNATLVDPILEATITTLTLRGTKRDQKIMGISYSTDVPALGSRLELRIGNQPTPARVIDLLPMLDSNLASEPVSLLNYSDLGGVPIQEDELIDIRLVDPGAAEVMAGVIWVEDFEPEIPIPKGQMVNLRFGGTNDITTSLAVTGFDLDARKLINERIYTPYEVMVRPEDAGVKILILRAGKDVMTMPPIGRMVYPKAPLQFTGQQYNSGQVIGKALGIATKVEIIMRCVESEGPVAAPSNSTPVIPAIAPLIPGTTGPGSFNGGQGLKVQTKTPPAKASFQRMR